MQSELEDLEDAGNELMLVDEEEVRTSGRCQEICMMLSTCIQELKYSATVLY